MFTFSSELSPALCHLFGAVILICLFFSFSHCPHSETKRFVLEQIERAVHIVVLMLIGYWGIVMHSA